MNPDLIAALNPPRLPQEVVAAGPADLLAAFGIGLLLSALLVALARPFAMRRTRPEGVEARLAALRDLPPGERLLAQARLLAEAGARLPPDLRTALYAGASHDAQAAEAAVRSAWRQARRRGPSARDTDNPPSAEAGDGRPMAEATARGTNRDA